MTRDDFNLRKVTSPVLMHLLDQCCSITTARSMAIANGAQACRFVLEMKE